MNRPPGSSAGRRILTAPPNMGRSMNMTEEEARESWGKLETAMKHIHQQNASHLSFEELYRTAYTLVLHRHGQLLYSGFENSLRQHLHQVRAKFKDKSGMAFVSEVLVEWASYHKSTQMIRDILMYMDRTFVKNFEKSPVYAHGMVIWRDEIVHYPEVGGRLLEIFLDQVAADRSGVIVDRGTLSDVTKMMLELGKQVYVQDLQEPFLAKSKEFFRSEVQRCLSTMNCPEYFRMVEQRIAQEKERAEAYLDVTTTTSKLLNLVDDVFVSKQLNTVLIMEGSGFDSLLANSQISDLKLIYNICSRVPQQGPGVIRSLLQQHVRAAGQVRF